MQLFIHQKNFIVPPGLKPGCIVSLVPSQTELLYDLGLESEVGGITKFCIRPAEWYKNKPRVGGTKTVDIEKVKALQPDLILANKEENVREQIEELAALFPVYLSDIATLNDALEMIQQVGILVKKELQASDIASRILKEIASLGTCNNKIPTAYLIWRNPYMTVGGDTYISDMMELCGFENVFIDEIRYPEMTIERLQLEKCRLLILSSEPYPFKEQHIQELQNHLPEAQILLADGEMFSWFGSRLLHAPAYFKQLKELIV